MYASRTRHGPAERCFTDRFGGVSASPYDELNLALDDQDAPTSTRHNLHLLLNDFAPGAELCDLVQVHGAEVVEVDPRSPVARPEGDALVTREPYVVLMVRAADCVPVLFHAPEVGAVAAAHCGRPGLLAGVVPRTVERLRSWGETGVTAWVGPSVCGACAARYTGAIAHVRDHLPSCRPWLRCLWSSSTVGRRTGCTLQSALSALVSSHESWRTPHSQTGPSDSCLESQRNDPYRLQHDLL